MPTRLKRPAIHQAGESCVFCFLLSDACQQRNPNDAYHHQYHNGQVERTADTILDRRWLWWLLIARLAHVFGILIVRFPFHYFTHFLIASSTCLGVKPSRPPSTITVSRISSAWRLIRRLSS